MTVCRQEPVRPNGRLTERSAGGGIGVLCSNQSQLSILDRVIEIHPNVWYCSKVKNTANGTVVKYYSKFMVRQI
jgi:hypothetical protein